MRLSTLLEGIAPVLVDRDVTSLTLDSREAATGSLFFALPGEQCDGRDFIQAALSLGVSAIVYESKSSDGIELASALTQSSVPIIGIANLRDLISEIAARFYAHPSKEMVLIGITGTNGKSSVAYMLAQALTVLGKDAAMMGTIGIGRADALKPAQLTTPDAITVQAQLRHLLDDGVAVVCMEVSSHGLVQARVEAVEFMLAVFTNLTQDHLDYHGDMQRYGEAKQRLFDWPTIEQSIVNIDDDFAVMLTESCSHAVMTYGQVKAALTIAGLHAGSAGLSLSLSYQGQEARLETSLVGEFNAWNLAAVAGVLLAMDFDFLSSVEALHTVSAPEGRAELISAFPSQPYVVVDFAHTPDALDKILSSLRQHCVGELAVVMGCGGDRDKGKRPLMGQIAEANADKVFLTDDNPRSEMPADIIADIASGMSVKPIVIHDRREAITTAINAASSNDWVLIAGKGHETTQTYSNNIIEFSDRLVAKEILECAA